MCVFFVVVVFSLTSSRIFFINASEWTPRMNLWHIRLTVNADVLQNDVEQLLSMQSFKNVSYFPPFILEINPFSKNPSKYERNYIACKINEGH